MYRGSVVSKFLKLNQLIVVVAALLMMPRTVDAGFRSNVGFWKQAGSSCGGSLVGGYCWHLSSASNQSCDTVCAAKGGTHRATRFYTGSYGSGANCSAVMDALAVPAGALSLNNDVLGCFNDNSSARFSGGTFTSFSSAPNSYGAAARLACACNDNSAAAPALNEVTGITGFSNSTGALISFNHTGGGNAGYKIAYQAGGSAPASCSAGTVITESSITRPVVAGKISHFISGLNPSTSYNYRICATNDSTPFVQTAGATTGMATTAANTSLINKRPSYGGFLTVNGMWGVTSSTTSLTVGGTNRFMVVNYYVQGGSADDITSMTFNGVALTKVYSGKGTTATFAYVQDLWVLVAPPVGTYDLVVTRTTASTNDSTGAVYFYTGVDQTTPYTEISKNTYFSQPNYTYSNTVASAQDKLITINTLYNSAAGINLSSNLINLNTYSYNNTALHLLKVEGDNLVPIYMALKSYNTWGSYVALQLNGAAEVDCVGGTPVIGSKCTGGAIYAGTFQSNKYMVTPGGCDGSLTPTCTGEADSHTRTWQGSTGSQPATIGTTAVTSEATASPGGERGDYTTPIIAAHANISSDSAADYCNDLVYGGYSDWYLPSKSELIYLMCQSSNFISGGRPAEDVNCASYGRSYLLTGFMNSYYWSSTRYGTSSSWKSQFGNGGSTNGNWSESNYVRCARRY